MIDKLFDLTHRIHTPSTISTINSADYDKVIDDVVNKTQNDVILFTIIIMIALVIFFIPFYVVLTKNKKQSRKDDLEEEKIVLDVISNNTEAFTILRSTLTSQNQTLINLLKDINAENKIVTEKMLALKSNQLNIHDKLSELFEYENKINDEIDDKLTVIGIKMDAVDERLKKIDERSKKILEKNDIFMRNGLEK